MTLKKANILNKISPTKIILPMLIGLAYVGYLFYKDFNLNTFSVLSFSWFTVIFLFFAFLMMVIRDVGYMVRLKILTGEDLNWKSVFNIIMLWEFTSAITPSAIGGTSVAVYFIHKEGVSIGKSTSTVLATSFLDELYFLIMFPLMFLIVSGKQLFLLSTETNLDFTNKYFYFAIIGFSIKFIYVAFIGYGLFKNPKLIKKIIVAFFKLPILRKWKNGAIKAGDDIITSSKELKLKPFKFWIKSFVATFFSWSARYWVVNMILLAIIFGIPDSLGNFTISISEHVLIFARQLVMWIMMIVMPTPGGSGFAEAIFSEYMAEFAPAGFIVIIALLWRFITYYPYLIIGSIIVPRWAKKILSKKTKTNEHILHNRNK